ncbi:17309_t:CDS:2, partial [Acaulospora colombiana]
PIAAENGADRRRLFLLIAATTFLPVPPSRSLSVTPPAVALVERSCAGIKEVSLSGPNANRWYALALVATGGYDDGGRAGWEEDLVWYRTACTSSTTSGWKQKKRMFVLPGRGEERQDGRQPFAISGQEDE